MMSAMGWALSVILLLALWILLHHLLLRREETRLRPCGKLASIGEYQLHTAAAGDPAGSPALVLLSGAGTPAPAYDFAPLIRRLESDFPVFAPERAGYGYSDWAYRSRALEEVLEQTRQTLFQAGAKPPFVLIPHSMSGLEALHWAQRYPDEVLAIIGLDMAWPQAYDKVPVPSAGTLALAEVLRKLGVQRLLPRQKIEGLSPEEAKQARMLYIRNFFSLPQQQEALSVIENAVTVQSGGIPALPFLLFAGNGKGVGDFWLPCQREMAEKSGGRLIELDCGHYLHHFEADRIAEEIRGFLKEMEETP